MAQAPQIRRLLACAAIACLVLAALLSVPAPELRRSGILALPLAALMVVLAALLGTAQLARARATPIGAGRAARLPQVFLIPTLTLPAAALAWRFRPALAAPECLPQIGFLLGGSAMALAFLLLIAERTLAQTSPSALPEAVSLHALLVVATGTALAAGVLEILANLGIPETAGAFGDALALLVAAIAVELAIRAALRIYLPPAAQDAATAAANSLIARTLAGAGTPGGIAAPMRAQLGIDFSRSWALAYMRAAALPMTAIFALVAWGLTGITLVPLDGRAVYERFGAPAAVLHPGLHAGLPWPLGTARMLEYGAIHEIGLEPRPAAGPIAAEDPTPAAADRLWEAPHPGEITLVIASDTNAAQSFQSVSADLRVLYRIGMTDADATRAAYATASPEALVRALAGRVLTQYFAARTLDAVLGANRETMAQTLRTRLQAALDGHGTGMEAVGIIIEAIHPPPGAADAYHNVRAAEIAARTSVAVEHGAAATIAAQSRQFAYQMTSAAHAAAAEIVANADAESIRFDADRQAARAGGASFLLERYFTALASALGRAPKTIIDHRLNWPEAPVLDLRPYAAATGAGAAKEE